MSKVYKHLSIEERYNIKEMRDKGLGISEIARKMYNGLQKLGC